MWKYEEEVQKKLKQLNKRLKVKVKENSKRKKMDNWTFGGNPVNSSL